MPPRARVALFTLLAGGFFVAPFGFCQAQRPVLDQMSTEDRLKNETWWPTKAVAARSDYTGPQACAECHDSLAVSQKLHSMAQASLPAADSRILAGRKSDSFRLGAYSYQITAKTGGSFQYSVTDGRRSVSGPITWAFGAGKVGQSYLSADRGQIRELRFSFFQTLQAFHITPNQSLSSPASLDRAIGRIVGAEELRRCFGCHSTAANVNNHFEASQMIPGVTCEACHGPGAKHVRAMGSGDVSAGVIFNPASLKPADSVDFCGACHNAWWDVHLSGSVGLPNVRFQPYRLQNSACWTKADARITCIACHDPHKPLVREVAFYDRRCLSCHLATPGAKPTADHPGAPCTRSKANCVSCHMPKYRVDNMHFEYTDHKIRVVRPGEGFVD